MKSNRQKQRFCHPKMADLKAWSHGVRKANYEICQRKCGRVNKEYDETCEEISKNLNLNYLKSRDSRCIYLQNEPQVNTEKVRIYVTKIVV